jgi:hypothetical protein
LKVPHGHINWGLSKVGCLKILVMQQVPAATPARGRLLSKRGKLVVSVLETSLPV